MAYRIPEFQDYFLDHYVAVPLEQGDGLFFNPALFHAAGANSSSGIQRSANLLQISSAFGKPMETIDSLPLIEATWEDLRGKFDKEGWSAEVEAFVGNLGEGYSFPTNLDKRVPETAGMAPESEQGLLKRALEGAWGRDEVLKSIREMREDSRA